MLTACGPRLRPSTERPRGCSPRTRFAQASLSALVDALASAGVSQRHLIDAATWRTCLESLHDPEAPEPVRAAVFEGRGTVSDVLSAVSADRPSGQPWFPYLRGPKVSVMWVRMLVEPGGAALDELRILPVAVDVQVRKVTEYLGIADTRDIDLEAARPVIQEAWQRLASDAVGPASLSGTTAALDPALWFFAKWGCTFCERAKRKMPIHSVCEACSLGGNR